MAAVGALGRGHELGAEPHPQLRQRPAVALQHVHAAARRLAGLRRHPAVGQPRLEVRDLPLEPRRLRPQALRLVVLLRAAAHAEVAAAGVAGEVLVAAHERRRHRAGGDHERLGLERPKQERECERHHDRLDGLAAVAEGAAHRVAGTRRVAGVARGHHRPAGGNGAGCFAGHGDRPPTSRQSTPVSQRPPRPHGRSPRRRRT